MADTLARLLEKNKDWASGVKTVDPEFFERLATQQKPEYLWIGCADSRVPANQIVNLPPGAVFVHRNVANVVAHSDINCLSVVQYAVEVLQVKHILVCGHYGCGGVAAAMGTKQYGLIDNWLRNIKDIYLSNEKELLAIKDEHKRADRLCELNVIEQARHIASTTIVQNAWDRGQDLVVHGVIYSLKDGLLRECGGTLSKPADLPKVYQLNGG